MLHGEWTIQMYLQEANLFTLCRQIFHNFLPRLPEIVENYMLEINKITGRNYHLFNYFGAPDAEHVIIAMGSINHSP